MGTPASKLPRGRTWAAVLLLVGIGLLRASPARAQTISAVELAAVTVTEADLPGYVLRGEPTADLPANFDAAFERVFIAPNPAPQLLAVYLASAKPAVAPESLQQVATAGTLLNRLGADPAKTADFTLTGSLGAGDADNSASWYAYDDNAHVWLTYYADVFVRGRILVTIVYAAAPATANPAELARAATAQDARIVNGTNLPATHVP